MALLHSSIACQKLLGINVKEEIKENTLVSFVDLAQKLHLPN